MGAKQLVIGYDHRFGKNREGGFDYLSQNADRYGLTVEEIPREDVDAVGVSSTRIRQALRQGDVATANRYLGYHYPLTGRVVHGQQLGRTIGYPTANLRVEEPLKLVPARGIYAVWATTAAGTRHPAMLSIGVRPTIGNDLAQTIEVNLLDFSGDLYDQLLTLEFVAWLRAEEKYDGLDALTAQLALDARNTTRGAGVGTNFAPPGAVEFILRLVVERNRLKELASCSTTRRKILRLYRAGRRSFAYQSLLTLINELLSKTTRVRTGWSATGWSAAQAQGKLSGHGAGFGHARAAGVCQRVSGQHHAGRHHHRAGRV